MQARPARRGRRRDPGSLAWPFMRHLLLFVAALIFAAYVLPNAPAMGEALAAWLLTAALVGVLAALIDRGWLGIPFLISGLAAGVLVGLHLRLDGGARAGHELAANGLLYVAALGVVAAAYAVGLLVVSALRRRA